MAKIGELVIEAKLDTSNFDKQIQELSDNLALRKRVAELENALNKIAEVCTIPPNSIDQYLAEAIEVAKELRKKGGN